MAPQAPPLTEAHKALWVYISNLAVAQGRATCHVAHESWQGALQRALGPQSPVNLAAFTRITPPFGDHRLILEAPSPVELRALLLALRKRRT